MFDYNGRRADYRALSRNIMCVAITRVEGAWCAYIDTVKGQNHDHEWEEVLKQGTKLSRNIAEAIFPQFKELELPYAY